jgi:AcrR family transcriptional regulator
VGRWEPDARGRLERAALELYVERGFEQTTVAEIAKRAGLTERTFFRHFADKREVLFGGASALQEGLTTAVTNAPDGTAPIEVVAIALDSVGDMFEARRSGSRLRQTVIVANPELQERELIKLARLSAAIAEALRARGVAEPAASMTAEVGIAAFRVAFERWIDPAETRMLAELLRESFAELRALTQG